VDIGFYNFNDAIFTHARGANRERKKVGIFINVKVMMGDSTITDQKKQGPEKERVVKWFCCLKEKQKKLESFYN